MVGWPAMKPESALRLLHWAVLAFVLIGLGPAWAQDAHPLDLDQTRAALSRHRSGAQGQEPHRRRSADPARPRTTRSASLFRGRSPISRRGSPRRRSAWRSSRPNRARPRPRPMSRPRSSRARKSGTTRSTPTCAPPAPCCCESRRHLDPHQRGAAPIVRAPHIRQVVERPRSAALGRRLAGSSDRRRGDAEPDRQLARRGRRAAVDGGENRHCGGRARARAGRRAACVAHAPGRLSRSRRGRPKPAPPRARRRVDLLHPGGAAARRPWPAGERARRLRPFRSERPGPHRRGA